MTKQHHIKVLSHNVNRNRVPIIDEIGSYCTACDEQYMSRSEYRRHLHGMHGIALPRLNRKRLQTNRDIIPDVNDKNNHCASCNRTHSSKTVYMRHLVKTHGMKKIAIKQEDVDEKINIRSAQTS